MERLKDNSLVPPYRWGSTAAHPFLVQRRGTCLSHRKGMTHHKWNSIQFPQTNKKEREEETLFLVSTSHKSLGKAGLLIAPRKGSQMALSMNFHLGYLPRNRQHSCRFFLHATVIYLGLIFEQTVFSHAESRALTEITMVHFPDSEPNLLETQRDCRSCVLIPYFRARILRSGSKVARNVGLLISGLLILDQHVTILGHCRVEQPWLVWHWTQQLVEIWASTKGQTSEHPLEHLASGRLRKKLS